MSNIDASSTIINSSVSDDAKIYKNAFIKDCVIGEKCMIGDMCRLNNSTLGYQSQIYPNGLMYSAVIGDYTYTQKNCSIWYSKIGKFCSVSWNVSIGGANHYYNLITTHSFLYSTQFGMISEPMYDRFETKCEIGNDVWIGAGAQILRGVTIGDGAVIAAGSIVTKDVEPYMIVAGVPAKPLKSRFEHKIVERLLAIEWWNFPPDTIRNNISLFSSFPTNDILLKLESLKQENLN